MIRVPDWAFEAAGQELRGMGQDTAAYHPGLYLTAAQTTASESNLFEHLINVWEFSPGPTLETCSVYFLVDFKFRSPLYRQHHSKNKKCFVCNMPTGGIFNTATEIRKRTAAETK